MSKLIEYVYVVVDDEGKRHHTFGGQTLVFVTKHNAISKCGPGYRVLRLAVSQGEEVYVG